LLCCVPPPHHTIHISMVSGARGVGPVAGAEFEAPGGGAEEDPDGVRGAEPRQDRRPPGRGLGKGAGVGGGGGGEGLVLG